MTASADAATASPFNPLAGNPLRTRADVATALASLFEPLRPCFSTGQGRVCIDASAASYARTAIELEGFARPLWGLAAAAAGGVDRPSWWTLYRAGLARGLDPEVESVASIFPGDRLSTLYSTEQPAHSALVAPSAMIWRANPLTFMADSIASSANLGQPARPASPRNDVRTT